MSVKINILPIIDYSLTANWYPDVTESKENLPLESSLETVSYSDFTSTIYDSPNPCEIVEKKPLYLSPSEINFAKAYIDWLLLQKGATRKDYRAKSGKIRRTLLLQFKLTLPFTTQFIDPDFWLQNTIIIPTYYVDMETEKHMCFRFQSLVLTDYSVNISTDSVNTIQCTVFGYEPDIIFLDKLYEDKDIFENWISKDVSIHTFPDDIGLVSQNIVFSTNITYKSNVSLITYKDTMPLKDTWYLYIPNNKGAFERVHGFITLSDYPTAFDTYDWILIQSQPQYNVQIEIFDPNYKLTQLMVTRCNIYFGDNNQCLGKIFMHVQNTSFDMYRVTLDGFGKYHP